MVETLDISGLQCIIDRYQIGEHGLLSGSRHGDTLYNLDCKENLRQLWWLQKLIPVVYSKSFSRRGNSSYGVKHVLEDLIPYHRYCSNASTIIMMMYLGYCVTPYREKTLNMNVRATRNDEYEICKRLKDYIHLITTSKCPYENP